MADFRWDPVNGQWVIIAENRATRPNEFRPNVSEPARTTCPFCKGNESKTPKEIAIYKSGNGSSWLTRIFSNKYPAVHQPIGEHHEINVGPYRKGDFLGHHEVIVESPDHKTTLSELSDDETDAAFRAYRDRILRFSENPNMRHAMLFKNCRPEAGASIEHLHSQLLCTSVTTEKVMRRIGRARQYYEANHQDVISAIVKFELDDEVRIVEETEHFVAYCPYASRFGYLVSVATKSPSWRFYKLQDELVHELGSFVRKLVVKLETCIPKVAYNFLLHLAPFDITGNEYYQWHVELFPRLANPAGYEWGTGCWINPVAPETAAKNLREC